MRAVLATALTILPLGIADAHIHLTSPLSRTDSPTGDQKAEHCGVAGQGRTARVTTLLPGATITVTWDETINHPGHYRIAFQPDGDTFPIPPPGTGPEGFPTLDQTGTTDNTTGAMILADMIPDGMQSTSVTLPNMECNNCTLQFIQVMTDKPDYTTDANSDDIYFNCADLTLSASAPPPMDGAPTGGDAGVDPPGGGGDLGGCSATKGSRSGIALGLIVGALLRLRRSRSRR